jgi:hypothetical protein
MGEREQFLNQSQYYNANAMLDFLSDANETIMYQGTISICLFQNFNILKTLIFNVLAESKNKT